jgi:hypothetical protein
MARRCDANSANCTSPSHGQLSPQQSQRYQREEPFLGNKPAKGAPNGTSNKLPFRTSRPDTLGPRRWVVTGFLIGHPQRIFVSPSPGRSREVVTTTVIPCGQHAVVLCPSAVISCFCPCPLHGERSPSYSRSFITLQIITLYNCQPPTFPSSDNPFHS